jgi:type IV pilus assembly protein PilO
MASLRDLSVFLQALVALAIAVVLAAVGIFMPGSPVARAKEEYDAAVVKRTQLTQEVTQLQVYKQRYGELKQQMDALNKQLDTLKTIVPEEKEADEFIRLIQGAASSSSVQIRRLKALAIVPKEYHYEMPFEIQADGPYFNVLDFFGRMGRLSRIINVGDLAFDAPENSKGTKYPVRPGTTVSGTFTATTFFTKPADSGAAPAPAGGAKPGSTPGKP